MPRPEGFHTITPYLILDRAAEAIAFYKRVFGAEEEMCDLAPDGRIRHAHIRIGDSPLMITSSSSAWKMFDPKHYGGSPVHMFLYVEDADSWYTRAMEAGSLSVMEMSDKEYGRTGGVTDPFGMTWWITTHKA